MNLDYIWSFILALLVWGCRHGRHYQHHHPGSGQDQCFPGSSAAGDILNVGNYICDEYFGLVLSTSYSSSSLSSS